jgi:3'-phosphoadenosine 5'-phosphosulfate sulfotransferase (PAPS reductase)/FAD synthetase
VKDPFIIDEPTVVSFSGGRTSAYMLWRVLQSNNGLPDEAIVCFANTGKEEEATLEFVRDCSINWNVKIHWVEYRSNDQGFEEVTFETASRNGEPFEQLIIKKKYLPNPVTRFCTIEMKIRAIHKFLKSKGWKHNENMDWVGIRADEPRRVAKIARERLPLVTAGITAKDVGKFWSEQSFDLKLPNINGKTLHGNCDLCFLKGAGQTLSLIAEKPERAIWWARMETLVQTSDKTFGAGDRFRKDRPSYKEMMNYAQQQTDFFGMDDESIACFCGD